MTSNFDQPGNGAWKLTPRETLVMMSHAFAVGYGLVAIYVFFQAISSPFLFTTVYVEPWLVIPEMVFVFLTLPIVLFGLMEAVWGMMLKVRDRKKDSVIREALAGFDTV